MTVTTLPTPDLTASAGPYTYNDGSVFCNGTIGVSAWSVTTPAAGNHAQTVAAGGTYAGLDFAATNTVTGGTTCAA